MEAALVQAGIHSVEELRRIGADAAYARIIATGGTRHIIAFTAIEMGLQGRDWRAPDSAEKATLRARFDAAVSAGLRGEVPNGPASSEADTPPDLAAFLDDIGLPKPR